MFSKSQATSSCNCCNNSRPFPHFNSTINFLPPKRSKDTFTREWNRSMGHGSIMGTGRKGEGHSCHFGVLEWKNQPTSWSFWFFLAYFFSLSSLWENLSKNKARGFWRHVGPVLARYAWKKKKKSEKTLRNEMPWGCDALQDFFFAPMHQVHVVLLQL